jgi:hypothetical protein
MAKRLTRLADAFVGDPRPTQAKALPEIEDALREADVVVVLAPVAAGKTKLAEAISRWTSSTAGGGGSAGIGVPTNALADQYQRSLKAGGWTHLRRRDSYPCHQRTIGGGAETCQEHKERAGAFCRSATGNRWSADSCPWVRDLGAVRSKSARFTTTWHGWMAHKLAPTISIQDEAHGLVDFLSELGSRRLWRSKWHWPRSIRDVGDVERWVDSLPADVIDGDETLQLLRSTLSGGSRATRLTWGEGEHFGRETEFISLRQMDGSAAPPVLWPMGRTQKVVLLSATLSKTDIEDMGLAERRVRWVQMDSEIPEENRPLIVLPRWDSRMDRRDFDQLRSGVEEVLDAHKGQRGIVHATYGVAAELRALTSRQPRLMFHNGPHDKRSALDSFLRSTNPEAVLVISGQYEGLDLAGDIARFQILTSAPRQSLSDQWLRYLSEHSPERYEWLTVRDLAQAYGRVCRGPDDFGVTLCLDASAERELRSPLIPKWMRRAIHFPQ